MVKLMFRRPRSWCECGYPAQTAFVLMSAGVRERPGYKSAMPSPSSEKPLPIVPWWLQANLACFFSVLYSVSSNINRLFVSTADLYH